MIVTLKALSALLTYPCAELQAAAPEIGPALAREGLLPPSARKALEPLLGELAAWDLMDLQERFVLLFDRSRTLSLNLFEHVHGESRDRGQAMVDLIERPYLVHAGVERMVDAWMVELDQFVEQNLLSLDCDNTRIGSGGYGYVSALPGKPSPGRFGLMIALAAGNSAPAR